MEKLEGLPVTPFMDRDKVTKPSSQTGFIRFVLFPLFIELANLFPCLEVSASIVCLNTEGIHFTTQIKCCVFVSDSNISLTQWEKPWITTQRWRKH